MTDSEGCDSGIVPPGVTNKCDGEPLPGSVGPSQLRREPVPCLPKHEIRRMTPTAVTAIETTATAIITAPMMPSLHSIPLHPEKPAVGAASARAWTLCRVILPGNCTATDRGG
ncbi:unnamed protein product [Heligmosomoides polygyrus]|uniref:Uncharacterized protein n=1 Tax=Heligmosomoides polygyrus TaxID=6339 RepID=A0A183FFL4_HELPZ|nr:unnamed protein product [Heligmosomoides polygyrus]